MTKIKDLVNKYPIMGWALFLTTIVVVYFAALFASSIMERRAEVSFNEQMKEPIAAFEVRSEKWAHNFPRQYERWLQTKEGDFASREGGNVMIDMLERDPRMVVLWAGYAFSRDYNQARGHYWAVEDIRNSLRTGVPMAGTCWTCKSPDAVRIMDKIGADQLYAGKWIDFGHEMYNPIGCLDCHDPGNMDLTITRPALIEAFERQGKDVFKSTHQEMRTLVCAQCHVEYYFRGEGKYLAFPWDKGKGVEAMEEYFDEINHVDWVHTLSKAPMLKAQHPDYELWEQGIHAQRGVSCADCHMPYRREGGVKFTDHHIQSPLANISNSCQVCHRESEQELRQNVFERQDKIRELRISAEDALVKAHVEAKAAWEAGATEKEMQLVLQLIRHAQWRWDYAAASHGGAFHAPLEMARILGTSIERAQEARLQLSKILLKYGINSDIQMPDISTKAKAQAYIGLNMDQIIAEKRKFLQTLIPEWDKVADKRHKIMDEAD